MKSKGFYTDIKESIEKHFSFLEGFGFSVFEEKQLAYDQTVFLNQIAEQYAVNGKEINDSYLKELSEILKRNIKLLNGDLEVLKSNAEIIQEDFEAEKAKERIHKGTYTLEYQFFSTDEYDAYAEFNNLKELKKYLAEHKEIEKYRVLDCYMNEINLS